MIPLSVTPNINEAPWKDCAEVAEMSGVMRIGLLPGGTVEGNAVVALLIQNADGSKVLAQTTYKLLAGAMKILEAANARTQAKNN